MNLKNKNWKTTVAGLGAIMVAVGVAMQAHFDGNPETIVQWEILITAVFAGVGLLFARDGDKSSESVGAR